MPIDASIYGQIQAPRQQNPMEQYAQLAQLQGAQSQNRLAELQMQGAERTAAGEAAVNSAYQSSYDPATGGVNQNRLLQSLASGGQGSRIPGIQKSFADQAKSKADMEKTQGEVAKTRREAIGQTLGSLATMPNVTHQDVAGSVQQLIDIGQITPEIGQKIIAGMPKEAGGLKSFLEAGRNAVMSAKEQRSYTEADANSVLSSNTSLTTNAASNATSRANNSASVGATMRGQNMTDARSREANKAAALSQPFTVAGADGKDVLVQQNKATGQLQPVQGGYGPKAQDKAPTEFQGKSATYGSRAEEADKILLGLDGKYSPAAVNSKQAIGGVWGVGGALEAGANLMLSKESQKVEQAQRNFVNAVLRQESGAAISAGEFTNAAKQYFPQPGDSLEVIQQKAANRKTAIAGFRNNAGKAAQAPRDTTGEWSAPAGGVIDFGSLK